MDKQITIGGKSQTLRANALLPRKYRHYFNRDLISDMKKMVDDYKKSDGESYDTELFENLTWLMLREGANPGIPETPEGWLASIDSVLDVYQALPVVVELWALNEQTTAVPKKK